MEKDVKKKKKTERERARGRRREAGWERDGGTPGCASAALGRTKPSSFWGFRGGHGDNGGAGQGVQPWGMGEHLRQPPRVSPHRAKEWDRTYWRKTSFLLRNLKKVGSQTSPCRRHVSVQACRVSDTHTCSESTGGQAWGSRLALGDHTRWVALGDRASTLGGLCIAGLLALGGGGGDVVVQKS